MRKRKHVITFAYNWLPFRCSKINKYEDHFFVFFIPYNKSFSDQASLVKMAGYWRRSLFVFMDLDFVSGHKNAKRELCQYLAILTLRLVNNIIFLRRKILKAIIRSPHYSILRPWWHCHAMSYRCWWWWNSLTFLISCNEIELMISD